jgi:hypothetical protein
MRPAAPDMKKKSAAKIRAVFSTLFESVPLKLKSRDKMPVEAI